MPPSKRTPGFSKDDEARLPTRAEVEQEHREFKAYETYVVCGYDLLAAAEKMEMEPPAARALINRGQKRYRRERWENVEAIRMRQAVELDIMRRPMLEKAAEGHNTSTDTMLRLQKREAELFGTDAEKEKDAGPQVFIVDARLPWEREETIDGEAFELPALEEGSDA